MRNIKNIVDRAGELDSRIKKYQKELKELKKELKLKQKKTIEGEVYICTFSPSSKSNVDPKALLRFLKKNKKERKFVDLVKVDITATRYFLREDANKIIKMKTDEFGTIKFIKREEK